MEQDNFSPEQSLQLIRTMIDKTRGDMSDNSFYFLVWGWLTFVACIGQFILKHIIKFDQHYQVWWLMMVGMVLSIWYSVKEKKRQKAKTYIGESMKWLWIGMGICFFVLSMIFSKLGWEFSVFPFFIMLYGLGTFVSGSILQFKPLIVGGILAWAIAIGAAFVEYDYQLLLTAAAILFSYIIPAYLLRQRNKFSTP